MQNIRGIKFYQQYGVGLLEAMVALVIVGMLLSIAAMWMSEQAKSQSRSEYQKQLIELSKTIDGSYLAKNYNALVNSGPVLGFSNPLSPTIAELRNAKLLRPDFPNTGKYGGNFVIEFSRAPAGCVMPNCDLQGFIRSSTSLLSPDGTPDLVAAANMVKQGGGDFIATVTDPAIFHGADGARAIPNPANRLAMVGVIIGYNSSGWGAYVRADGSTVINGNQVINGNPVINGKTSLNGDTFLNGNTIAQNIAAQDLNFRHGTGSGNLNIGGATALQDMLYKNATGAGNHTVNGNMATGGQLQIFGDLIARANAYISGNTAHGGDISVGGTTTLQNLNAAGQIVANGNINSGGTFNGNGGGLNNIQYAANSGFASTAGRADTAGYADVAERARFADSVNCSGVIKPDGTGSACDKVNFEPPAPVEKVVLAARAPLLDGPLFSLMTFFQNNNRDNSGRWVSQGTGQELVFGGGATCVNNSGVPGCSQYIPNGSNEFAEGYYSKCEMTYGGGVYIRHLLHGWSLTANTGLAKNINGQNHYKWVLYIDTNEDNVSRWQVDGAWKTSISRTGDLNPSGPSAYFDYTCYGYTNK